MTIEERVEKMSQLIWLDVSEPMLPLVDRYRLMKDRILYQMNVVHAEGVAEGRKEGITKGIARNAYEMGKHEGVAEGVAEERERIRNTGEFIKTDESMSGQEGDWASLDEHRGEIEGMSARCDLFITRAAVLAPTKAQP